VADCNYKTEGSEEMENEPFHAPTHEAKKSYKISQKPQPRDEERVELGNHTLHAPAHEAKQPYEVSQKPQPRREVRAGMQENLFRAPTHQAKQPYKISQKPQPRADRDQGLGHRQNPTTSLNGVPEQLSPSSGIGVSTLLADLIESAPSNSSEEGSWAEDPTVSFSDLVTPKQMTASNGGHLNEPKLYAPANGSNPNIFIDSSDSSAAQRDPLKWWHQKYAQEAAGATNMVIENAISKVKVESDIFNHVDEEEDDIFDGLEDEEPEQQKDANVLQNEQSEDDDDIRIPNPWTQKATQERTSKTLKSAPRPKSSRPSGKDRQKITVLQQKSDPSGNRHSGMMLDENRAAKSVTSDITSSLVAGTKGKKKARYRPDPEDTILEESPDEDRITVDPTETSVDVEHDDTTDEEDESMDHADIDTMMETVALSQDESMQDTKEKGSVFLNIGCAIVDSFRNACQVPGKSDGPCDSKQCISSLISLFRLRRKSTGRVSVHPGRLRCSV
jgi:hypothetical protein